MLITAALCALSLRAIQSNRKPHISEREIRLHHAMWRRPSPRVPKSGARVTLVKLPPPSTASVDAMSRYFESQCTPADFLEARSDRDFNNRLKREFGTKGAADARYN
jgi:hypothetical protein